MTTAEKLVKVAENVPKVYKAGQKSEYDRFWDAYQQNGNRKDYTYGFSGYCWDDETFKPKYDIAPTSSAQSLFQYCQIADIKGICERYGVVLDLSHATITNQLFYGSSSVVYLPKIDLSNSQAYRTFYGCTQLKIIDELILSPTLNLDIEAFYNCGELTEIRFGNTITKSIDIHWSKNLSMMSLKSIVESLSDTVTGQTITFPTTAESTYNSATISGRWKEIVASKPNWTFAYA